MENQSSQQNSLSKHWHIYVGPPRGAVIGNVRFDDAAASVAAYSDLIEMLFSEFITTDQVAQVEFHMHDMALRDSDYFIYADGGNMRVAWTDCEECNNAHLN